MLKNTVELGRPQMTILRMRIACWINKPTNTHTHTHTHSQYVILTAFALQQRLQERTSLLRHNYEYITCLVNVKIFLRYHYVHARHWRGKYVGVMGVYTNVQYAVSEYSKCSKAYTSICAV